jgi:hypothetical protein
MYKIEDYEISITQYNENLVEISVMQNNEFIVGTFTVSILNMSDKIKKIIKYNELCIFGYMRFEL